MDVSFCGKVMEEAFGNGCPEIFNSNKGSQFTSNDFTGILLSKEIAISMDGRGRTFDNIFMERLWKSVKYEEVYLTRTSRKSFYFSNVSPVCILFSRYITFYISFRGVRVSTDTVF